MHHTYFDAIVPVALSSRVTPVVSRLCLRSKTRGWLLTNYGVIWTGTKAISEGVQVIEAGKVCWLAPHGFSASRHGTTYRKARLGAARMAQLAQRPVVTVEVVTNRSAFGRPTLEIRIGQAISPHQDESPRQFTDRFMAPIVGGELPADV